MKTKSAPAAASLVLLTALLAGLSGCRQDVPYDKYAIVYGVSDYPGNGNDLTYSDADAASVSALLTGQGYSVVQQVNSAANRSNLLLDVGTIAGQAGEDDLFVFYYSGHGGQAGVGPEPAGSDGAEEWIFLHDSVVLVDPGPPEVFSIDLNQTFSDDQLVDAFSAIKCRKMVIILDSCNSGGFISNPLEADGTPPTLYQPGDSLGERVAKALTLYANFGNPSADIPPWEALVISAAGERELSYEAHLPYEHGVFTYYLLQTDSRGDADGDGYVTVTEAFDYAQRMISRDWNRIYGFAGAAFSPRVSGGPVDYVLFEAR